LVIDFKILII